MGLWEWLQKAAQHKYLRRIPTGKPRPRYRYIYHTTSKHHDVEHQVGEKVKITEAGQIGHFEVRSTHGDWVTLKHDESGQEVSIKKDRLLQMFRDEHVHKPAEEAGSLVQRAFRLTNDAQREGSKESHLVASMAHDTAADKGAEHAPHHRRLAVAHVRAAASIEARQKTQKKPPKMVIKLAKRAKPPKAGSLGTKQQAWDMLMEAVNFELPQEYTKTDQLYLEWRQRKMPKPPPYTGGELDSVNESLGRKVPSRGERLRGKKDTRVSSLREGFEKLTAGITRWDDPRMKDVLETLRDVPGLEKVRLPESAVAHAVKQKASAEQEAHYREMYEAQGKQGVDTSFDPDEIGGDGDVDTSFDFGWNVTEARKSMSGIDALGDFLEKNMYGPRVDDWAMQFSGTPMYQRALELTKQKLKLDGSMHGMVDNMPDAKKMKARAKVDQESSALERKLIDHRIQQEKAMSKADGIEGIGEYLEKGHVSSGHRYAHVGEEDPEQEATVERQAKPTREAFDEMSETWAYKAGKGKKPITKADDGKPGESLGETDTAELQETHGDLMHRLKGKPGDAGMTSRLKAICSELKRRGKHKEHGGMEKGLPSEEAGVSSEKAKQILRDGEVHGRPLTEAQRGMFGAIAGKAKKSMDGITALGEYFEKGHGGTLGETVVSSPQINLGAETGAISGDSPAGQGALPHGDTQYYSTSEADGDEEKLKEHKTGYGPNPMAPSNADAPDDMAYSGGGRYRKSDAPDGTLQTPARQLESVGHQRAAAQTQLQKSDDILVVGGDPTPIEPEPEMNMSKAWRQGELVTYTDFSDRAASELVKSEQFYHGPPPNPLATGVVQQVKECANGHVMKAMFTACDVCGVGSSINPISGMGMGSGLQKSMKGLQPTYEEDMCLPAGTLVDL